MEKDIETCSTMSRHRGSRGAQAAQEQHVATKVAHVEAKNNIAEQRDEQLVKNKGKD
jgi:hypothetical protein